jgi:hypothetical protein
MVSFFLNLLQGVYVPVMTQYDMVVNETGILATTEVVQKEIDIYSLITHILITFIIEIPIRMVILVFELSNTTVALLLVLGIFVIETYYYTRKSIVLATQVGVTQTLQKMTTKWIVVLSPNKLAQ